MKDNYAAAGITFIDRGSGKKEAYMYPITKIVLMERDDPSKKRVFKVDDFGKWREQQEVFK